MNLKRLPTCPRCGSWTSPKVLGGLCAKCLVRVSVGRPADEAPAEASLATRPVAGSYFGDFEILDEIGRGGMGVVWRARQISLNRIVALKTLKVEWMGDLRRRFRFQLEAETAGILAHPNIVPVFEVGDEAGHPFLVMGLIEGGTLADRLETWADSHRHRGNAGAAGALRWMPGRSDNRLSSVALVARLARAVHHAHERGVLHCDLKPGNILIGEAGEPYIADFGLAGWKDRLAAVSCDEEAEISGTPAYMAPEQASHAEPMTTAVDIYSLGAILHHLLVGRSPTRQGGGDLEPLEQEERLPQPSDAAPMSAAQDRDLAAICRHCLASRPTDRYGSAAELAEDLERWTRGEEVKALPDGPGRRILRWACQRPGIAALSALSLLLFIVGMTGVLIESRRAALHATAARAAMTRLWEAAPVLARAHRDNANVGARRDGLLAIATAARIRASTALRNEAAATLAREELLPAVPGRSLPAGAQRVTFSRDLDLYAVPELEPPRWRLVRITDDSEVAVFEVPTIAGEGPRFSADGRHLGFRTATISGKAAELFVWDLGRRHLSLRLPAYAEGRFDFAHDGAFVAYINVQGVLERVSVDDPGMSTPLLSDAADGFPCFAPDGRLAFLQRERLILIDSHAARTMEERALGFPVVAADWSPDGGQLALGGVNHEVRLWRPGESKTELLGRHEGLVHHVEFSPGGGELVSNGYDGTSRIWEVSTGRLLARTQEGYAQQFSPDGLRIGWFRTRQVFGIWTWSRSPVYRAFGVPRHPGAAIRSAEFDFDGRWLLLASSVGVHLIATTNGMIESFAPFVGARAARWWPARDSAVLVASDRGLHQLELNSTEPRQPPRWSEVRDWGVPGVTGLVDVAISQDGRAVLTASGSQVWRIGVEDGTFREAELIGALAARGRHVGLGSDARWAFVSPDYNQGSLIFDLASRSLPKQLHPALLSRGHFSPDGRCFADGFFDAVRILEVGTWQTVLTLGRDSASDLPGLAAFSPDNSHIAWTPQLRQIRLSELQSGSEWVTLVAPDPRMLTHLFFSGDGQHLGAQTSDHFVQIWHLAGLRRNLATVGLAVESK